LLLPLSISTYSFDKRFLGSTNYELMMTYLEERREERQRIGPEEIREWKRTKQKQSKNLCIIFNLASKSLT
jgi:hypothetical protein